MLASQCEFIYSLCYFPADKWEDLWNLETFICFKTRVHRKAIDRRSCWARKWAENLFLCAILSFSFGTNFSLQERWLFFLARWTKNYFLCIKLFSLYLPGKFIFQFTWLAFGFYTFDIQILMRLHFSAILALFCRWIPILTTFLEIYGFSYRFLQFCAANSFRARNTLAHEGALSLTVERRCEG